MVEVVFQAGGVTVADGEGGGSFGGVGEPVQLGQRGRGAVRVALPGQVREHPTGRHRTELLVVADQPDTPTRLDHVPDHSGEVAGAGHPGLVDHHQRPRPHLLVDGGPGPIWG